MGLIHLLLDSWMSQLLLTEVFYFEYLFKSATLRYFYTFTCIPILQTTSLRVTQEITFDRSWLVMGGWQWYSAGAGDVLEQSVSEDLGRAKSMKVTQLGEGFKISFDRRVVAGLVMGCWQWCSAGAGGSVSVRHTELPPLSTSEVPVTLLWLVSAVNNKPSNSSN